MCTHPCYAYAYSFTLRYGHPHQNVVCCIRTFGSPKHKYTTLDAILVDETFPVTPEIELNVLLMAIMVTQIALAYTRYTVYCIPVACNIYRFSRNGRDPAEWMLAVDGEEKVFACDVGRSVECHWLALRARVRWTGEHPMVSLSSHLMKW